MNNALVLNHRIGRSFGNGTLNICQTTNSDKIPGFQFTLINKHGSDRWNPDMTIVKTDPTSHGSPAWMYPRRARVENGTSRRYSKLSWIREFRPLVICQNSTSKPLLIICCLDRSRSRRFGDKFITLFWSEQESSDVPLQVILQNFRMKGAIFDLYGCFHAHYWFVNSNRKSSHILAD